MSHSSNIQLDDNLIDFINKAKQKGNIRAVKILIKDEKLVLDDHVEPQGSWKDDFIQSVKKMFLDKEPCYVLLRLDSAGNSDDANYDWILICWSPDDSHVRQKMLYASTKSILKLTFTFSSTLNDIFATCQDDFNPLISGDYFKTAKQISDDLLTVQEQDLRNVKREEALSRSVNAPGTHSIPGIEFPITDEAVDGILRFKEGSIGFAEFSLDLSKEMIQLESTEDASKFDVKTLGSRMPTKNPRYILFVYPHQYEGASLKSIIFVYWVPGSGCSIKEKMLYSTCKLPLLAAIQDARKFGIEITKKLEIDDIDELKEDNLLNELHPPNSASASKPVSFAKPQGPAGKRGAKRLIRTGNDA
ncbi:twinfilin-1 [Tetranychus urticae]|uniref:Twinfilin n=1 Tax=Tetranychus urticae TaxID=32264 RepID=T1K5C3_TETUR|nr:twinfilin-1 [Tetranychus urticae]